MKSMTGKIGLFASLVAMVGVQACTTSEYDRQARLRNPAPCPNVLVLQDAAKMVEFSGEEKSLENIAYSGEITGVRTSCRYFAGEPIEATLEVSFAMGKGPQATSNQKTVPYFVAITRKNRDLIARQEFSVPVKFKRGRDVAITSDVINKIIIPRANENISGDNFEIVVGLDLNREQIIYNRSGKSLKFPGLK